MENTPKKGAEELDFFELDFSDSPVEQTTIVVETEEEEIETETPEVIESEEEHVEVPLEEDEDEVIKANFEFLKTQGALFLPDDYEFKATAEGLEKAVADSAENFRQAAIGEMFEAMPQEGRDLLQYYLNGGTDVKSFMELYAEVDLEKVDLESEESQEWAVRQLLKETTKFSDARIERTIEQYKDDMRLKEEANEALPELIALRDARKKEFIESEKIRNAEIRKKAEEQRLEFQNILSSVKEINGIPYTKEDSVKAIAAIYNPVRLSDGSVTTMFNYRLEKALSDPKTVALLNKLLESDFKLDTVVRKKTTDATESLKKKLKDAQKFKGGVDTRTTGDFDFSKATLDLS